MSTLRTVALLVTAVGLVTGCSLIAAPEEAFLLGEGGAGGATSSAGGGPGCTSPADCEPVGSECEQATCEGGVCGVGPRPAGTPVADPTAGDCQASECDGEGNAASVVDDSDLPNDLAECTDDLCTAGVPTNPNKPADSPCGIGGALFCDGSGSCVGCTDPAQCAVGDACKAATCTAGVCDFSFTAAGALPTGQQIDGDCQTAGCDGAGFITSTDATADVPLDGNSCTQDLCTGSPSVPSNPNEPTTTVCGTNLLCNGMGVCVGCNVPADCGTDTTCQSFTCTSGVCGTVDANNGTPCTDGTFCNGLESCNGSGVCGSSAGDPCAPDGDDDCMDACDEATDSCTANSLAGAACPNGTFCDGAEACDGFGFCADSVDPCAGHDVGPACNDSCNEAAADCTANDAVATPCPDATFCDGAETCDGSGTCGSGPGNPCPGQDTGANCNDSCDEGTDDCTAPDLVTCGDTFVCGAEFCDDGNLTACGFCNADCTDAGTGGELCGDGVLCSDLATETCDDFNAASCGSCNATCDGAGTGTCAGGMGCAVNADCTSNVCLGNVCVDTLCSVTGTALLAWSLDLPAGANWDTNAQVPYAIDNRGPLTGAPFTRVAYCLELSGTWVYAEMDDFTGGVVSATGIPTDAIFETGVANITLRTNSPSVTPVTNAMGGLIEFWPNCYTNGLNGVCDYDDDLDASTDCYGSFQVHHNTTTALSVSRWSAGGSLDLGIGNQPSGHPDWTFTENAGSFAVKKLQGFIVP